MNAKKILGFEISNKGFVIKDQYRNGEEEIWIAFMGVKNGKNCYIELTHSEVTKGTNTIT